MKKFAEFSFLGNKGNALKVGDWAGLILGVFVTLMAFSLGQWLFQIVAPRTKAGGIDPIVTQPSTPKPRMYGVV